MLTALNPILTSIPICRCFLTMRDRPKNQHINKQEIPSDSRVLITLITYLCIRPICNLISISALSPAPLHPFTCRPLRRWHPIQHQYTATRQSIDSFNWFLLFTSILSTAASHIWSDWIHQHTSMKHLFLVLAKPIKHPFGSIDSLIRPIFWSTHSVTSLQWLTYSTSIRQLLYNWFWDHVLILILTSFTF